MNLNPSYKQWITELKEKVRLTQLKAAVAVNTELIQLYWDLGKMISEKQTAYGTGFLQQLSKDLTDAFPEMKGFSVTNLKYCRLFFEFYNAANLHQPFANLNSTGITKGQQPVDLLKKDGKVISQQPVDLLDHIDNSLKTEIRQQPVAQVPWGHNILIFTNHLQ